MFTKNYPVCSAPSGNCGAPAALHDMDRREPISFKLLLRSLPGAVSPDEILKRFFSSSLPPSFASGRFAAFFFTGQARRMAR